MEAEQQAQRLEHRFQGVFEALHHYQWYYSLHTRKLQAINQAHRLWLGYMPEDIASEELWFKRLILIQNSDTHRYNTGMQPLHTRKLAKSLAQIGANATL